MKKVTVNKDELLDKLKANKAQHRETYEEALAGYKDKVREELNRMLNETRDKVEEWLDRIDDEVLEVRLWAAPKADLPKPEDHTEDYDRAITMVEMSVDDELELTESEFAELVMDDWGWKGEFVRMSQTYS